MPSFLIIFLAVFCIGSVIAGFIASKKYRSLPIGIGVVVGGILFSLVSGLVFVRNSGENASVPPTDTEDLSDGSALDAVGLLFRQTFHDIVMLVPALFIVVVLGGIFHLATRKKEHSI